MAGLLGLDPQTLDEVKQFMGLLGADPEQTRKQALSQALMTAGATMLGTRTPYPMQALGTGLGAGVQQYNKDMLNQGVLRGQNMTQALQLMQLARQNQGVQQQQAWQNMLTGGVQGSQPTPLPTAPYQGQGMGDRGLGSIGAPSAPPNALQPSNEPPIVKELRDAGVSDTEIMAAATSPNPQEAVMKLLAEYRKPVLGQGNVPMLRTRGGGFSASPAEGYNTALAAQTGAQTGAQEAAKSLFDLVDVPVGNGQTMKMTRADYIARMGQSQAAPQGRGPDMGAIARDIAQTGGGDTATVNIGGKMVPYSQLAGAGGMGGLGVTPNPLAMKAGEQAIATQGAQNTKIAENYAADYTDAVKAEKQAPATIQKYQYLKNMWSNVETGKLAPTVQNLKTIAAYVAPEVSKEWTKDVPYYQAAQALSNAMALELRNPAGGAGMPGSLSDADRQYLQSMISTAQNDPRAIPMILDAKIALEKRNQDLGRIARNYRVDHNGQVDEGLYEQFQKYADTHPLFPKQATAVAPAGKTVNFSDLPK